MDKSTSLMLAKAFGKHHLSEKPLWWGDKDVFHQLKLTIVYWHRNMSNNSKIFYFWGGGIRWDITKGQFSFKVKYIKVTRCLTFKYIWRSDCKRLEFLCVNSARVLYDVRTGSRISYMGLRRLHFAWHAYWVSHILRGIEDAAWRVYWISHIRSESSEQKGNAYWTISVILRVESLAFSTRWNPTKG